jgi:hypothetical protein
VKGVENGNTLSQIFIFFNKGKQCWSMRLLSLCFISWVIPLLLKKHLFDIIGWVMANFMYNQMKFEAKKMFGASQPSMTCNELITIDTQS